jgi:hypothetical protein
MTAVFPRLRTGPRDWDAPQDESKPMRIYPGRPATTSSIKKRLGRPLAADQLAETFIDEEEEEEGEESSDGEMQWEKQLKRPRYSTALHSL